jgi:hypothetical protein
VYKFRPEKIIKFLFEKMNIEMYKFRPEKIIIFMYFKKSNV